MKKIIASFSILFMLASVLSAAPKKDIVDTAVGAGSFKTLVAAAKAAGLVDTLKGEGPFTVFAPTDEAFGKLSKCTLDSLLKPENKHKLAAILTYHVVPGKVKAKKAAKLDSAKTVNGAEIKIKPSGKSLMINNAKVVKADIKTSNGIIHVIDTVLIPEAKKVAGNTNHIIKQKGYHTKKLFFVRLVIFLINYFGVLFGHIHYFLQDLSLFVSPFSRFLLIFLNPLCL